MRFKGSNHISHLEIVKPVSNVQVHCITINSEAITDFLHFNILVMDMNNAFLKLSFPISFVNHKQIETCCKL